MAVFYQIAPITGTTGTKMYVTGSTYVVTLDYVPQGNPIIILNGLQLEPENNFYNVSENVFAIRNISPLIVGDVFNIFYQTNITVIGEVFTKNPKINWVIDLPTAPNGYAILKVKDITGTTVYEETQIWSGTTLSGEFTVDNLPTYGEYTYEITNKQGWLLASGEKVYTETTTAPVRFNISSDTFNKLT